MYKVLEIKLFGCLLAMCFVVGCKDNTSSPKQAESVVVETTLSANDTVDDLTKQSEGLSVNATPSSIEVSGPLTSSVDVEELPAFWIDFSWENVPVSSAHIGSFPYLTAPEGFGILKQGRRTEFSENGVTVQSDFDQLIMFDGTSFIRADGKKAELHFAMLDKSSKWNQYKFDRSVDAYLTSIGASLIFEGQIPNQLLKKLNEADSMTVHKYIQGDPWNKAPVRHYILNHQSGKVVFQVYSNKATGEVGVVELEGFKQTIKAPTASEIKQSIDLKGKAVLYILFDVDKATLKPEGQEVVDQIQLLLEQYPEINLSIEGHTDNTGSKERNIALSQDRANVVMYSLAAKGIKIDRLKATGYGETRPLVENNTQENKAKNRRVELVKF